MYAMDCYLALRTAASRALAHGAGNVSRSSEVNCLNVEADGSVLYSFKTRHFRQQVSGKKVRCIALYDAKSKENKVLHALQGGGEGGEGGAGEGGGEGGEGGEGGGEGGGDVLSGSVNARHSLLAFVTGAATSTSTGAARPEDPAGSSWFQPPAERPASTESPGTGAPPGARAFVVELPGGRPSELQVEGDSSWCQFLYGSSGDDREQESHLLVTSDTGRVQLFHVRPSGSDAESPQGAAGVFVMRCGAGGAARPGSCDEVVCRFVAGKQPGTAAAAASAKDPPYSAAPSELVLPACAWSQWDPRGQRLFYLLSAAQEQQQQQEGGGGGGGSGGGGDGPTLRCLQFYPDRLYQLMLELSLPSCAWSPDRRFVNASAPSGQPADFPSLRVVCGESGALCICYQEGPARQAVRYSILMVHHGYSFGFEVDAGSVAFQRELLLFTPLDGFVAVSLPGRFLHLVNVDHPWLPCHSLFLEGRDLSTFLRNFVTAPDLRTLGDLYTSRSAGTLHRLGARHATTATTAAATAATTTASAPQLGATLRRCRRSGHRMAALHAALASGERHGAKEQALRFLCRSCREPSTHLLQEFLVASVLGEMSVREGAADAIPFLPCTALTTWTEEIPGLTATQEKIPDVANALKHKASGPGFWSGLERRVAVPDAAQRRYRLGSDRRALRDLVAAHAASRGSGQRVGELLTLARRVLSLSASWSKGGRGSLPLFQEEDPEQMLAAGMLVDDLRTHLQRCLPTLGRRALEDIALSYVQIQLQQVTHLLESVWAAYGITWDSVCLSARKAGTAEAGMLPLVLRLGDAAAQLGFPLPGGFKSLQCTLGYRSMPLHSFLLMVDQGTLQLTDSFVQRLFHDLDDSPKNEQAKYAVLSRLSQPQADAVYQLWESPAASFSLAQRYAARLHALGPWARRRQDPAAAAAPPEKESSQSDFLPLRSFIDRLLDIERQVAGHEQEVAGCVDARFVEEVALKQSLDAAKRRSSPR
ncbi:gamma-secretase-activating protein isoform X1 [Petromyzon marinus]|uniref:gamma-secretase-activating protein isoform X1 n=1 Tax=Petromyzon marinus TaxID=7757 RepID=UPI003F6EF8F1